MRFKVNCDPRWQPLAQAVGQESGEVFNQMERDGQVTVDLLFPSYGQINEIPIDQLE